MNSYFSYLPYLLVFLGGGGVHWAWSHYAVMSKLTSIEALVKSKV